VKHGKFLLLLSGLLLILSREELLAQSIPLMIPHSGTVSVNGGPFNGNGQFKFAIITKDCTLTPVGPACDSLWSNDNTSVDGSEPSAAVEIPVTNGAFAVKLGDITLTNMPIAIPTTVFDNAETFLRVWFNDGSNNSQQLSPDRQLVSVPYAYRAEIAGNLAPGAVKEPIAFAFINANGTVASGTPNVTSTFNAGSSRYEITIDGENYFFSNYVTVVTPIGTTIIPTTSSVGGKLLIQTFNTAGTAVQTSFQFVTFKP
jgi:hypothetical protein